MNDIVEHEITGMRKNVIIYHPENMGENLIKGVKIFPMRKNLDDRGWNNEVWHLPDIEGFSPQMFTDTFTNAGTIKAFHIHKGQDDLFYVMEGHAKIVLVDLRPDSPTFGVANTINCSRDWPRAVFIPRGVAHGYEAITDVRLAYLISRDHYEPSDEKKIPPGSEDFKKIGYNDWGIKHR